MASLSVDGVWPFSGSVLLASFPVFFSEARVLPRRSDVCPWGSSPSSEVAASYCRAFIIRSPVRERVVFPQVGLYVSLRPL